MVIAFCISLVIVLFFGIGAIVVHIMESLDDDYKVR